ncbi:HAUS augmin-like complex subunit 3 [Coturnix japonica]|uniref:HAUS augmin like complex subunit 3 n=1 Tax=Coturnix japonica TaxID=93934 RepID=A0A8C2SN97_COTJA|nr:HAUS augmin-like complex subunit 3 [Coturnix japonica]
MSCGKEFVGILKKIGYPKASELNGEDFDWLFESSEDKSFLEWFCGSVNEQHVVSEEELQDFNHLLESGRPILEGNALDEVLKTCKPSDSGHSSQVEEEELKRLEDEFQSLQKMRNLTVHRYNKLQLMISENSSTLQTLKVKEEEAQKDVKEGLELFNSAMNKFNAELLSLVDRAKKLVSIFTASEQGSDLQPVLFSQLSLAKYLAEEEQCTAALDSYAKRHLYQDRAELAENVHKDNAERVDISKRGTAGACGKSQEIASLQAAYICAQRQLIELQAEEQSLNSAIECAVNMLPSLQSKGTGKEENIEAEISSLNDEVSTIKQQIAQINNEDLPSLLKERAQLFTAPVLMAALDHEIAQQHRFAAKRDEICSHLIRQKASFELIQLAYDIELKKHKDIRCQLEDLIESLQQSSNEMQQRLEALSKETKPEKPRNAISSKDEFACRLYQLLEGENKKQLFKTYTNLEQMAQKLNEDCVTAQDQLAASSQEQTLLLSKLDSDVNALRDSLYCGRNRPLLTSRELTEQFHQLEGDLSKLNQLIVDLTADLKSKRNFLASDKLRQMERNLYVYFFKDQNHLKEMVEKLEQQAEATASGLEDENFTPSEFLNIEKKS